MDDKPEKVTSKSKGLIFVWVSFCVFVFVWFVKKVSRGRQQLRNNFTTIEEELRRVQRAIESNRVQINKNGEEDNKKIGCLSYRMRTQKVSVDVWKMIISMGSYLGLAFMAWIFLKLFYACFWFPNYLKKEQMKKEAEETANNGEGDNKENTEAATDNVMDKKND